MNTKVLKVLAGLLLILSATILLASVARFPHKYQWDFQTYYYASLAFSRGSNPYDLDILSSLAQSPISLKFMYPPHVLAVLQWIPWLTYNEAHLTWLVLKALSLFILLSVWSVLLAREKPGTLFFLFAAVAFNGTIVSDLVTGNVAIIEQALLWTAFLAFTRGRWLLFALFIAAGSFFKVTNALFLGLLMFAPPGNRLASLLAGGSGVALPLVFSVLRWPGLFQSFLENANVIGDPLERGARNPCLSAFLLSLADVIRETTGWEIPPLAVVLVFMIHAVVALTLTAVVIRRSLSLATPERYLMAVSLACLVYPLVVPRFKNYAFIQLIPPAYLLLRRLGTGRIEAPLLAFIVMVPTFTLLGKLEPLAEYYLLFVSYGLWVWMMMLARDRWREQAGAE